EQNNNHQRVCVNLFLVVEDFGACLRGRRNALPYLHRRRLRGALLSGTAVTAGAALQTSVGTLSGLRNLTGFTFNFRDCGSNEFTIHLLLTSISPRRVFANSIASGPVMLG